MVQKQVVRHAPGTTTETERAAAEYFKLKAQVEAAEEAMKAFRETLLKLGPGVHALGSHVVEISERAGAVRPDWPKVWDGLSAWLVDQFGAASEAVSDVAKIKAANTPAPKPYPVLMVKALS